MAKVTWRKCDGCGSQYLPSVTSKDVCGVCVPVKAAEVVRERCRDEVPRPLATPHVVLDHSLYGF